MPRQPFLKSEYQAMRKFIMDFVGLSLFLVALSGTFVFAEALGHIAR